eukprot:scaffold2651_cov171-Amphora_coffeaeformis.AAC.3
MKQVDLLSGAPPFYEGLHCKYITELADKLHNSYEGAVIEHLRVSGVYWSLTALSLLLPAEQVMEQMRVYEEKGNDNKEGHTERGFGGNTGQDAHLLYTLSAIQILALADRLQDERLQTERVVNFVASLQQSDGSFCGDRWGEIDTRFTYCALSTLSLLHEMDAVDVDKASSYIIKCRNIDGGFGCVMGAESHAGWWLCERQVDSGGLNGRPEKQADVCYSWWLMSTMSILNKVSWINEDKLATFILKCQDDEDGGIADRPNDMPDVYHTFFGIAGLSLLGHLHQKEGTGYRQIDPMYALPTDVVKRLKLPGQVVTQSNAPVNERLSMYDVYDAAGKV